MHDFDDYVVCALSLIMEKLKISGKELRQRIEARQIMNKNETKN